MKVRALVSFGSPYGSFTAGDEFELPDGVDWLKAGLVELVERAAAPRKATSRKRR